MNTPYALIPVGIITLLFYLSSYILSRLSLIPLKAHRQFWNILLLITFLVTAILGIILVLRANYKLNIPIADELLVWHVNFGIGMAMVAIFHFLWHWDYYYRIIKPGLKPGIDKDIREGMPVYNSSSMNKIQITHYLPVFLLGFTALTSQIVLLREFLSVFYGNELVIGIILAIWMVLTGLGARMGRYISKSPKKESTIAWLLIILGLLPVIIVFLLNYLRNIVFEPGSLISLQQIIYSAGILLLPFCVLSGYLFTFLC